MQGLPGQTLPGTVGERGLPGEKVSLVKGGKAHSQDCLNLVSAFSLKPYDTCCHSG